MGATRIGKSTFLPPRKGVRAKRESVKGERAGDSAVDASVKAGAFKLAPHLLRRESPRPQSIPPCRLLRKSRAVVNSRPRDGGAPPPDPTFKSGVARRECRHGSRRHHGPSDGS